MTTLQVGQSSRRGVCGGRRHTHVSRVRVSGAEIFSAALLTAHTGQSLENPYRKRVFERFATTAVRRASPLLRTPRTTMSVAT